MLVKSTRGASLYLQPKEGSEGVQQARDVLPFKVFLCQATECAITLKTSNQERDQPQGKNIQSTLKKFCIRD